MGNFSVWSWKSIIMYSEAIFKASTYHRNQVRLNFAHKYAYLRVNSVHVKNIQQCIDRITFKSFRWISIEILLGLGSTTTTAVLVCGRSAFSVIGTLWTLWIPPDNKKAKSFIIHQLTLPHRTSAFLSIYSVYAPGKKEYRQLRYKYSTTVSKYFMGSLLLTNLDLHFFKHHIYNMPWPWTLYIWILLNREHWSNSLSNFIKL